MRILQVHTAYRATGGEDVVVTQEAALLRAAGHDVVTHLVDNPQTAAATARGLAQAPWNVGSARAVRMAVQLCNPDVVHVHNTWFALSPSVIDAVHGCGVPLVVTLHNYRVVCANAALFREGASCTDCFGGLPWPAVRHRCYRGSGVASAAVAATIALHDWRRTWHDQVDVLVTPSGAARSLLVAGGLPADTLVVKPNSVPDPGPRRRAPSVSGTVLFVGRLTPEKGADLLLDAWAAAAPGGLELLIVGDGPERAPLAARAPATVRFLGSRAPSEVAGLMLGARALAVPSRWSEPFGLVAAEAFAAGLPVIASSVGALEEMVATAGGTTVPATIDGWRAGLATLADGAALDVRGRGARRAYTARFSPERGLADLEAVYRRARTGGDATTAPEAGCRTDARLRAETAVRAP